MTRLPELLERRGGLVDEMSGLVAKETAGALADEERARFDDLDKRVKDIDAQIDRARRVDELERRAGTDPVTGELAREIRGFSVVKAIQEAIAGRLSGREREVHDELSKGREVRGVMIPSEILLRETRSQTVGSDPAGGYNVATNLAATADRFRPMLMVESMGATVLRNLTGNLDLPALASSGSAHWVAENQNTTRSAATFEKIAMSPKTVSGEYRMSRRLLLQTGQSIEELLRRDLGFILAQALDLAAINGSGVTDPLGILQTANVEKVTTESALSDTTANLIGALELDDVSGTRGFLTNPTVGKAVRKVKDTTMRIIPQSEIFHGERVEYSSQVPTTIGAGSNKSGLIFGAWSHLVIGYWSAVDILVNPYHADVASNGGALLHAFLDADVAVRHTEAFAYAEI